jgi:hypothetical protein
VRDTLDHHQVFASTNVRHLHVVVVEHGGHEKEVHVGAMCGTEDHRALSVLANLLDLFQTVFVDDNLFVHRRENGFHHLRHASERAVVVVGDDCLNIGDSNLLTLSVHFVLSDVLHQLPSVVR